MQMLLSGVVTPKTLKNPIGNQCNYLRYYTAR